MDKRERGDAKKRQKTAGRNEKGTQDYLSIPTELTRRVASYLPPRDVAGLQASHSLRDDLKVRQPDQDEAGSVLVFTTMGDCPKNLEFTRIRRVDGITTYELSSKNSALTKRLLSNRTCRAEFLAYMSGVLDKIQQKRLMGYLIESGIDDAIFGGREQKLLPLDTYFSVLGNNSTPSLAHFRHILRVLYQKIGSRANMILNNWDNTNFRCWRIRNGRALDGKTLYERTDLMIKYFRVHHDLDGMPLSDPAVDWEDVDEDEDEDG
jgi:hypothetical protein